MNCCPICNSEIWYHPDGTSGCGCINVECPWCKANLPQWQAQEYEDGKEVECWDCGEIFSKTPPIDLGEKGDL